MRFNIQSIRVATSLLCTLFAAQAWAAAPTLPLTSSDPAAARYTYASTQVFGESFDSNSYCRLFNCVWPAPPGTDLSKYWNLAVSSDLAVAVDVAPYPGTTNPSLSVWLKPTASAPNGSKLPDRSFAQIHAPLPALVEGKYYTISMKVRGSGSVVGKLEVGVGQGPIPTSGAYIKSIPLNTDTTVSMSFVYKPYRTNVQDNATIPSLWIMPLTMGMNVSIDDVTVREVDANPTTYMLGLPTPGFAFDSKLMGLTVNQWDVLGGAYPQLSQKVLRLWDNGVYWGALEPTRGVINADTLARMDRFVTYASSNGMDVVYTMGLPPPWATGGACTVNTALYEPGNAQLAGCGVAPSDLAAWRTYVTFVAQRYKGKIKFFELWNEPDATFNGDGYQLATLAREAKAALQQVDPSNTYGFKLMSPGFTTYGAYSLEQFLDAGGAGYVDIFAYHNYYPVVGLETQFAAQATNFKQALYRHGVPTSTPVWNSEGSPGCLVGDGTNRRYGPGCPSSSPPNEDVLRGVQVRALASMWLNGLSNFDYYHMVDVGGALEPWRSLANIQTTAPYTYSGLTPLGQGMAKAFDWLKSAKAKSAFQMANPKVFIVNFTNFESKNCYLVWSANESMPVAVTVPAWSVTSVHRTDGSSSALPLNREITLQPLSPVLLKP